MCARSMEWWLRWIVRACYESKFGKPKEKDIMEEKKTKTMTKAEAFEWLKCKKIDSAGLEISVQNKLFSMGIVWGTLDTKVLDGVPYILINSEGKMSHCGNDTNYWLSHCYEAISANEVLSLDIEDEKKKSEEEEALDKISYLGAQIVDILLRMKGHHHVTITETTVALHDEGMCLFHSDPF